jgi:hypothetical protein
MENDYLTKMLNYASRYSKLAYLSNIKYHLLVYGTNVTVKRAKDTEARRSLGSSYIFDDTELGQSIETFQKRIVINRSNLVNTVKTTDDDLEAYTTEDFFVIGDQVEFTANNVIYRYKVVSIDQFDPHNKVLFKITMSGF